MILDSLECPNCKEVFSLDEAECPSCGLAIADWSGSGYAPLNEYIGEDLGEDHAEGEPEDND